MTNILERLFKADYDTSLIRKWDRHSIGSSFRYNITWFRVIAHSYAVSFMIILVVYSLGTLKVAPENLQRFLLSEKVAFPVMFYVGFGSLIVGSAWLIVGRYGRNTKSAAVAYYRSELDYYKKKVAKDAVLPADRVEYYWNGVSPTVKRDAILAGYQLHCSKKGYTDEVGESFLSILNTENPTYENLPAWLTPLIKIHTRFYYWDKEKMDSAWNALKALAEQQAQ
jgi:hypothetical protein